MRPPRLRRVGCAEGVTLLLATSRADIAARTDARLALAGPPAP